MTRREWYGRVLVGVFGVNTVLAVMVALVSVSRFELNGGFDFVYWLVFVVPAVVVGFLAALSAWSVTVGVTLMFAKLLPRVHPSAVVATALVAPGLIALLVYRPWEVPNEIVQPAQPPEIIAATVIGSILAIVVVHRADRSAARSLTVDPS